jgi:hypothetical protein
LARVLLSDLAQQGLEILDNIDMEKVIAAVRKEGAGLPDWDLESVADMIWGVCDKWLSRDTKWMYLQGIEERYNWNGESGIYDVRGTFTGDAPEYLRGKTFIRDWKTSSGELDARWAERYNNDNQWRMYLWQSDADIFLYSGVNRKGDVREIYLHRPDNLSDQVRSQLMGLDLVQQAYLDAGLTVFPLSQPSACSAYGRRCARREECTGFTMPRRTPKPWNWSPSAMSKFSLCPERFRRYQIDREDGLGAGGDGDTGPEARVGTAFHAGIAEIYKQVWGISDVEKQSVQ